MKTKRERSLGRGLSELLTRPDDANATDFEQSSRSYDQNRVILADINLVHPNPDQPRKYFDEAALQDLANSIIQKGMLSPMLVRRTDAGTFEIVAGERRYRASRMAGLTTVPVIVKDMSDPLVLEVAIIENVQRENLNVVEEAEAYQTLISQYNYTQADIAIKVSKSRSHITNILRLLSLPAAVLELIKAGKISAGHAKALVGHINAEELAQKILNSNLNVRQAESLARKIKVTEGEAGVGDDVASQHSHAEALAKAGGGLNSATNKGGHRSQLETDQEIVIVESLLNERLNLKVKIENDKKTLTIWYEDLETLDTLLQLLTMR